MTMTRVNVFLTLKQQARLRKRSRETGASVAELVRRAIDNCPPAPRSGRAEVTKRRRTG